LNEQWNELIFVSIYRSDDKTDCSNNRGSRGELRTGFGWSA